MDLAARAASQARVRALLTGHEHIEIAASRSLQAFYEHTGVDFAAQCVGARGRSGGVPSTVPFAGEEAAENT